jgi:hypothetical protein
MEWPGIQTSSSLRSSVAGRKLQSFLTAVYGIRKTPQSPNLFFRSGFPPIFAALLYKDNVLLERSTWAH